MGRPAPRLVVAIGWAMLLAVHKARCCAQDAQPPGADTLALAAPPPARRRAVRPFDGAGSTVHHAALVGEPRAWHAAGAPLMRAGLLHLWLRCMCGAADPARGDLRDVEVRGLLFVEPRSTAHIASPAAPLLQVGARARAGRPGQLAACGACARRRGHACEALWPHSPRPPPCTHSQGAAQGFAPNATARLPDGSTARFVHTPPFIPGNVPSSLRLVLPGVFSDADELRVSLEGWPQYTLLPLADCAATPEAAPAAAAAAPPPLSPPPPAPPQPAQPLAPAAAPQQPLAASAAPRQLQVIVVSKMLYNQDMAFVGALVAASLEYHAALGVARWCARGVTPARRPEPCRGQLGYNGRCLLAGPQCSPRRPISPHPTRPPGSCTRRAPRRRQCCATRRCGA
jgi:hypothetical protein